MSQVRYLPLGPLMSGEGSRAFLGLAVEEGPPPHPVVFVWAPEDITRDPSLVAQLERETSRACVFEHPHILRVHGLVRLETGLARVTEYAEGESLRRLLEACKRLPAPLAARVVTDVAMGLHYGHMAGNDDGTPLVHGDVRPETVIVSFNGLSKVSGYGALTVAPREPGGRRVRNQHFYSAPEQLMGGRDAVSVRTDVFLLGLMLYECLSGKKPFQELEDPEQALLTRPLPPLPADVPVGFQQVIARATAQRANERFATPLELREALVPLVGTLPSHAQFSAFLQQHFPPDGHERATRQRMLEVGLANLRANPAAATSGPLAPPPAPVAPPPPAEPAPQEDVELEPEPEQAARRSSRPRLAIGLALLAFASAGAFVYLRPLVQPPPPAAALLAQAPSAPAPRPAPVPSTPEPVAAPTPTPDAGTPASAADGGTLALAGAPEPPAAAEPPATATLVLTVQPAVTVSLAGKELGRTPLRVKLPPGRHELLLTDEAKGVRTRHTVRLSDKKPTRARLKLGKGTLVLRTPKGASILVDGKKRGRAPLARLSLYEGEHVVRVTRGDAAWEQSFELKARKRLTLSAELKQASGP